MQAARGTSVDHPESGPDAPRPPVRRRSWAVFAAVAMVLYTADQWSKWAAVEHLTDRDDVRVVGDLLRLHLTRNPGAAFSLGTEFTVALSCAAILATVVVLYYSLRLRDRLWSVALGALLAGITGNLTDRLLREPGPFRGHVIDFFRLPSWPIFNVADIAINLGAALILVQVFRGVRLDGTRHHDDPGEDPESADQPVDHESKGEATGDSEESP